MQDDCAIKCQQFILEQFTGDSVAETDLVQDAREHGWYAPGRGTTPENLGNLLELHGVGVTHYEHANQFHLDNELAQGHKVMVAVESNSLWNHNPVLEAWRDILGTHGNHDHAVVVYGIDTCDPKHVSVRTPPHCGNERVVGPSSVNSVHGHRCFHHSVDHRVYQPGTRLR